MTTKSVATEQNNVHCEHNRAHSNSKPIGKPQRLPNVDRQNDEEKKCQIQKVAVHVLHDERKRTLTPVALARLTHRARRRIRPESFVIRAAIIIARHAKSCRRPENQQRRRENQPAWPPGGSRSEPAV